MKTKTPPYDIIGDIHGFAGTLRALLARLGYIERDGAYRHSERTVIFLGDFIDRGRRIRETLQIVRAMVDKAGALAVLGNHELNAIGYHTLDGKGGHRRRHTPRSTGQHVETLHEFEGREEEWRGYLEWFETLPLFLDLGGVRIVHACWDEAAIRALGGSNRFDMSLLGEHGAEFDLRQAAVNTLLKGPEINLPGRKTDAHGNPEFRVKWWTNERPLHYRNVALPVDVELPDEPIPAEDKHKVCGYAEMLPPVFFGHYGFLKPAEQMAPNVACIDLAVTRGGPLCAYGWDGEAMLDAAKFVTESAGADLITRPYSGLMAPAIPGQPLRLDLTDTIEAMQKEKEADYAAGRKTKPKVPTIFP